MLFEINRRLDLNERKAIAKYNNEEEATGFVIMDLFDTITHCGMLIYPHKIENMNPYIYIFERNSDKEGQEIVVNSNPIGKYTIVTDNDTVELTIE